MDPDDWWWCEMRDDWRLHFISWFGSLSVFIVLEMYAEVERRVSIMQTAWFFRSQSTGGFDVICWFDRRFTREMASIHRSTYFCLIVSYKFLARRHPDWLKSHFIESFSICQQMFGCISQRAAWWHDTNTQSQYPFILCTATSQTRNEQLAKCQAMNRFRYSKNHASPYRISLFALILSWIYVSQHSTDGHWAANAFPLLADDRKLNEKNINI